MLQLTNELNVANNSELKIQSIKIDSHEIFKHDSSKSSFPEFYCFDNSDNTTSSEELNFNNLKKCSTCCTNKKQKFLVLKLEEKHMAGTNVDFNLRSPKIWNENKKTFSFECKNADNDNTCIKFDGKLLGILHQGFSPTQTN